MGNTLSADGRSLFIITGANQGGKSTFLRASGLAHLMMQCGMFVAAEEFESNVCNGIFTHFKREEDATMTHGKLDEELARMSEIAEHLRSDSMALFNESFSSTNEREGSEISRQVTAALLERRVKVMFVTHQFEFASRMYQSGRTDAMFLRADRREDGTRTFRVTEAPPEETSYGADLYREVFAEPAPVTAGCG